MTEEEAKTVVGENNSEPSGELSAAAGLFDDAQLSPTNDRTESLDKEDDEKSEGLVSDNGSSVYSQDVDDPQEGPSTAHEVSPAVVDPLDDPLRDLGKPPWDQSEEDEEELTLKIDKLFKAQKSSKSLPEQTVGSDIPRQTIQHEPQEGCQGVISYKDRGYNQDLLDQAEDPDVSENAIQDEVREENVPEEPTSSWSDSSDSSSEFDENPPDSLEEGTYVNDSVSSANEKDAPIDVATGGLIIASGSSVPERASFTSQSLPLEPEPYMIHEDPRLWRVKDEDIRNPGFGLWWRERRTSYGEPIQIIQRLNSLREKKSKGFTKNKFAVGESSLKLEIAPEDIEEEWDDDWKPSPVDETFEDFNGVHISAPAEIARPTTRRAQDDNDIPVRPSTEFGVRSGETDFLSRFPAPPTRDNYDNNTSDSDNGDNRDNDTMEGPRATMDTIGSETEYLENVAHDDSFPNNELQRFPDTSHESQSPPDKPNQPRSGILYRRSHSDSHIKDVQHYLSFKRFSVLDSWGNRTLDEFDLGAPENQLQWVQERRDYYKGALAQQQQYSYQLIKAKDEERKMSSITPMITIVDHAPVERALEAVPAEDTAHLHTVIERLHTRLDDKLFEGSPSEGDIDALREVINEKDVTIASIQKGRDDANTTIGKQNVTINNYAKQAENWEKWSLENFELKGRVAELENDLNNKSIPNEGKVAMLESEKGSLQAKNQRLSSEIEEHSTTVAEKQAELDTANAELKKTQETSEKLACVEAENEKLTLGLADLNAKLAERDRELMAKDIAAAQSTKEAQGTIEDLKGENSKLTKTLGSAERRHCKVENELNASLREARETIQRLEQEKSVAIAAAPKIPNSSGYRALAAEVFSLREQLDESEKEVDQLRAQLAEVHRAGRLRASNRSDVPWRQRAARLDGLKSMEEIKERRRQRQLETELYVMEEKEKALAREERWFEISGYRRKGKTPLNR